MLAMTGKPVAHRPRRAAFSYIEAAISAIILGGAIATALNTFGTYTYGARVETETRISEDLAADLLAEILTKEFEDPALAEGSFGRSGDEVTRRDFDDVDDYHGWSESPPADPDGNALSSTYSKYRRTVRVWNVQLADMETTAANGTTPAKTIEVRVIIGNATRATARGHRTRHSGYE